MNPIRLGSRSRGVVWHAGSNANASSWDDFGEACWLYDSWVLLGIKLAAVSDIQGHVHSLPGGVTNRDVLRFDRLSLQQGF